LVRLSLGQLGRTFAYLFPGETKVSDLLRELKATWPGGEPASLQPDLDMPPPHVADLVRSTEAIARAVAGRAAQFEPCLAANGIQDRECVRKFIAAFGSRAFRRPLVDAEVHAYAGLFAVEAGVSGGSQALEHLLAALLLSPHFLYRTELGGPATGVGVVELTAQERAAAVSYPLTDGPPDAELLAAAAGGQLARPTEARAQILRLLSSPAAAGVLARVFGDHFEYPAVVAVQKDKKTYTSFQDGVLAAEMLREADSMVQEVMFRLDAKVKTLLSADFAFVGPRLAAFYGIQARSPTGAVRVTVPAATRSGLLTLPAAMAVLAREDESDVVARGRWVRERFLCEKLPEPPPNVNAVPPTPDGVRTQRERLRAHSADPSCAACHERLDPIGLALEAYDGIGQFRTRELGKPVDVSGRLVRADGTAVSLTGADGLARTLVEGPQLSACLVHVLATALLGPEEPGGGRRCADEDAVARIEESGGDLREAILAILNSESAFRRRR
jgi:hypothetical protein